MLIILYLFCNIVTLETNNNFIIKSYQFPTKIFYVKNNKRISLKNKKEIKPNEYKRSLFLIESIGGDLFKIKSKYRNRFVTLNKNKPKLKLKKSKKASKTIWGIKKETDGYKLTSEGFCLEVNKKGKRIKARVCKSSPYQKFHIEYFETHEMSKKNNLNKVIYLY
ncbi:hypothetical protein TUBRATIS_004760 [Tubulinosema ratisbonensis]|uniref:Ricin B lectin domain-containing protein n=1 Tax=Tubulinosema ratisbonensis TaxID=291195 RepID=A0A437APU8_9MICR|nr:hypothetical protein TUBRATIS_004760 [Tubulinosema ratisbonensis]